MIFEKENVIARKMCVHAGLIRKNRELNQKCSKRF